MRSHERSKLAAWMLGHVTDGTVWKNNMLLCHVLALHKFDLFLGNALFYALGTLLSIGTSILVLSPLLPFPCQPRNLTQHLKQKERHSSTSKGPLSSSRVVLDISLLR